MIMSKPISRLAGALTAALAAGALIAASPTAAQAAPSTTSTSTTAVAAPVWTAATGPRKAVDNLSTGGDAAVRAYWTADRLAKAISLDTPKANAEVAAQIEKFRTESTPQVVTKAAAPTVPTAKAAPPVTNFSHVNGKVFFRNATDGKNYICSGSALNSGSKRLVATAGHCVHGGPGQTWHQNWIFVPGYNRNSRPHGTFQAYMLRTFNDWINYGETGRGFNSDVAFVTTYNNASGQAVVNAVGGHGLITGGSEYNFDVSIFGYPGNLDSGEVMWACWGSTGTSSLGGYSFSRISGCNFGGGSSGGPWLKDYSNSTGLGNLKTITSWQPTGSTANINGPFFRAAVRDLWNQANADW